MHENYVDVGAKSPPPPARAPQGYKDDKLSISKRYSLSMVKTLLVSEFKYVLMVLDGHQ